VIQGIDVQTNDAYFHLRPTKLSIETVKSGANMRLNKRYTGWWYGTVFIFHNIWDNPMIKTTNQYLGVPKNIEDLHRRN
jgi:hypothetical protein